MRRPDLDARQARDEAKRQRGAGEGGVQGARMAEQHDLEAGIGGPCIRRDPMAAGIEPPLGHDHARGAGGATVEFGGDRREAVARQFAERLPDIGRAPGPALQREIEIRDHRRIEPSAEHLHEQPRAPIGETRQPGAECRLASRRQHRRRALRRQGQAQFQGQHIRGTQRQYAEHGRAARKACGHLRDGAIAAGRDDKRDAARRRVACQRLGMTRRTRLGELGPEPAHAERGKRPHQSTLASGTRCRIEDDEHAKAVPTLNDDSLTMC